MSTGSKYRDALRPGEMLQEYRIEGVLGQGGFGITYLARDTNLDAQVAIKEYLPTLWAGRDGVTVRVLSGSDQNFSWGLTRFLDEARTLARFRHPNIVQVLRYFQGNNTAYMVMHAESGQSLTAWLRALKREPSEEDLKRIILPLLDGLAVVHAQKFLHRDIKPANIIVRSDGSPVLLDFGAARQAVGDRSSSLTRLVSRGYTPPEQATGQGTQGPWTDLFALASVLYRAIAGEAPRDATERMMIAMSGEGDPLARATEAGGGRYGEPFLAAIDWALAIDIRRRPLDVEEWRRALDGEAPDLIVARRHLDGEEDAATGLVEAWTDTAGQGRQREADESQWRRAEQAGTLEAFESYLVAHPDGRFEDDARTEIQRLRRDQAREIAVEEAWQQARAADSAEAYRAFLEAHPESLHADAARQQVVRLDAQRMAERAEAADWDRARTAPSIEGFRRYLSVYPGGRHAEEAREAIGRLQADQLRLEAEQEALARARASGTPGAWGAYLEAFPEGKHAQEARRALEAAEAEAARRDAAGADRAEADGDITDPVERERWRRARDTGTAAALQAYLGFHPEGARAAAARQQIDLLQRRAEQAAAEAAGWTAVLAERTQEAYRAYLARFPDGAHAGEATGALEALSLAAAQREADLSDWQSAAAADSVAAYEAYLTFHPDGEMAQQAQGAIRRIHEAERQAAADAAAWAEAEMENSPESYDRYLDRFPDGVHAQTAMDRLEVFEGEATARLKASEADDWRHAAEADRVEAYRSYLARHPDGPHASLARLAIKHHQEQAEKHRRERDEALWARVVDSTTPTELRVYLSEFPDGLHAREAQLRLVAFDRAQEAEREAQEREAWQAAEAANSIDSYQEFLRRFPNADEAAEARRRAKRLEQEAYEEQLWRWRLVTPLNMGLLFGIAYLFLLAAYLAFYYRNTGFWPFLPASLAAWGIGFGYIVWTGEYRIRTAVLSSSAALGIAWACMALTFLLALGR